MARATGRVARDVLSVQVAGGSVLLHVPTGRYLRTNESAAKIVGLLSAGHSAPEVARRFAASEAISLAAAVRDVQSVTDSLGALGRASARPLPPQRIRGAARLALQWTRLPLRLRWPALQVAALMAALELGLRIMDLRRLSALARAPLSASSELPLVVPADLARLEPGERRMLGALEWLDGRWFTPMTCLRRALVMGIVLRRRRPVLRLGITGGGTTAHAWIEAEGFGFGMEDVGGIFTSPV